MFNENDLIDDSPWNRFSSMDNERICFDNLISEEYETDVPGLKSDAIYQKGVEKYPVFDVPQNEFTNNMEEFRSRMRFSGKAGEYLRGTRYKRPFYIRYIDESACKVYVRKVK